MAPQTNKSFMKDFRASFRRKKTPEQKIDKLKEQEEEELAKLSELKENLGPNLPKTYSDSDLLGLIRARSLNVKDAAKLLKLDENLKKLTFLDTLIKEYDLSDIGKDYKVSDVLGYDKEGCLIRVMRCGLCDFKEHDLLRLQKENKKSGQNASQICYILDLASLNISSILYKPVLDTALMALSLLQDHYHDVPKSIFIVNAPPLFSSAFKVFKPVIQDYLHKRIKIFGYDGYKEELLKHIDADTLPVDLGGNRVDCNNDPTCKDMMGAGGDIPPSFYSNNFLDPDDEEAITTTVPAGSTLSYRFQVPEEGSVIQFHLQAKDNDIGVCVFLDRNGSEESEKKNEDTSKLEQLVPVIRTQCHISPETSCFVSWFSGTLVFLLDNTYSWMSSKEVTFKINIIPPIEAPRCTVQHIRKEVMVPVQN